MNFDIPHNGKTVIDQYSFSEPEHEYFGYFTIEPGKYRVTFNAKLNSSGTYDVMYLSFYKTSGESLKIYNTKNGSSYDPVLETVTYEIDFTDIAPVPGTSPTPFGIYVYIGRYRGNIVFEPVD